ncbi:hypothetical protein ABZ281_30220, partial [Streptomyces sp. NPDC006265]|uniref:hypothetical protein n=1 Tax=Streptomyces sp. NPDC006265 TaxID=3156740 RepID=UPI0033AE886C
MPVRPPHRHTERRRVRAVLRAARQRARPGRRVQAAHPSRGQRTQADPVQVVPEGQGTEGRTFASQVTDQSDTGSDNLEQPLPGPG